MDNTEAVKLLAKSLYKELINNGFIPKDILKLSQELLDHVEHNIHIEVKLKNTGKVGQKIIG